MDELWAVINGLIIGGAILLAFHLYEGRPKKNLVVKRKIVISHEEMVYYDKKFTEAKRAKNRTKKLISLDNEICLNYEKGCFCADLLRSEIQKELNKKSAKK